MPHDNRHTFKLEEGSGEGPAAILQRHNAAIPAPQYSTGELRQKEAPSQSQKLPNLQSTHRGNAAAKRSHNRSTFFYSPANALEVSCYISWTIAVITSLVGFVVSDLYQIYSPSPFPLLPVLFTSELCAFTCVMLFFTLAKSKFPDGQWSRWQPFYGGDTYVLLQVFGYVVLSVGLTILFFYYHFVLSEEAVGVRSKGSIASAVVATVVPTIIPYYGILSLCGWMACIGNIALMKSLSNYQPSEGKLAIEKKHLALRTARRGSASSGSSASPPTPQLTPLRRLTHTSPLREIFLVILLSFAGTFLLVTVEVDNRLKGVIVPVFLALHIGCGAAVHLVIGCKFTPNYKLFMPFVGGLGLTFQQVLWWTVYSSVIIVAAATRQSSATNTPSTFLVLGLLSFISICALIGLTRFARYPSDTPGGTHALVQYGAPISSTMSTIACMSILIISVMLSSASGKAVQRLQSDPLFGSFLSPTPQDSSNPLHQLYTLVVNALMENPSVAETASVAASLLATVMLCLPFLTHFIGSLIFEQYSTWQPFSGPNTLFIALQALGWFFYSLAAFIGFIVVTSSFSSTSAQPTSKSQPYVLPIIAASALLAQLLVHFSLRVFTWPSAASKEVSGTFSSPQATPQEAPLVRGASQASGGIGGEVGTFARSTFGRREVSQEIAMNPLIATPHEYGLSPQPTPRQHGRGNNHSHLPPTHLISRSPQSQSFIEGGSQQQSLPQSPLYTSFPFLSTSGSAMAPEVPLNDIIVKVFNNEMVLACAFVGAGFVLRGVVDMYHDYLYDQEVGIALALLVIAVLAAPLAQFSALTLFYEKTTRSEESEATIPFFLKGARLASPFSGSGEYVAMQSVGWTLYAMGVLFEIARLVHLLNPHAGVKLVAPLASELSYLTDGIFQLIPFSMLVGSIMAERRAEAIDILESEGVGVGVPSTGPFMSMAESGRATPQHVAQPYPPTGSPKINLSGSAFGSQVVATPERAPADQHQQCIGASMSKRPAVTSVSLTESEREELKNMIKMAEGQGLRMQLEKLLYCSTVTEIYDGGDSASATTTSAQAGGLFPSEPPSPLVSPAFGREGTEQPSPARVEAASISPSSSGAFTSATPHGSLAMQAPLRAPKPWGSSQRRGHQRISSESSTGVSPLPPSVLPMRGPLSECDVSPQTGSKAKSVMRDTSAKMSPQKRALLNPSLSPPDMRYRSMDMATMDVFTAVAVARTQNAHIQQTLFAFVITLCAATTITFIFSAQFSIKVDRKPISLIMAMLGVLFTGVSNCAIHFAFGRIYNGYGYRAYMPFFGGKSFVWLQAVGWSTYGASFVMVALYWLEMPVAFGTLLIAAVLSVLSQVSLYNSVFHFTPAVTSRRMSLIEQNADGFVSVLLFLGAVALTHVYETVKGKQAGPVPVLFCTATLCVSLPLMAVALKKARLQSEQQQNTDIDAEEDDDDDQPTASYYELLEEEQRAEYTARGLQRQYGETAEMYHEVETTEVSLHPSKRHPSSSGRVIARNQKVLHVGNHRKYSPEEELEESPQTQQGTLRSSASSFFLGAPSRSKLRAHRRVNRDQRRAVMFTFFVHAAEYLLLAGMAVLPLFAVYGLYYYANKLNKELSLFIVTSRVLYVFIAIILAISLLSRSFDTLRHIRYHIKAAALYVQLIVVGTIVFAPLLLYPSLGTALSTFYFCIYTITPRWVHRLILKPFTYMVIAFILAKSGWGVTEWYSEVMAIFDKGVNKTHGSDLSQSWYVPNIVIFALGSPRVFASTISWSAVITMLVDLGIHIYWLWYITVRFRGHPELTGAFSMPRVQRALERIIYRDAVKFFDLFVIRDAGNEFTNTTRHRRGSVGTSDDEDTGRNQSQVTGSTTSRPASVDEGYDATEYTDAKATTVEALQKDLPKCVVGYHPHGVFAGTSLWMLGTREWRKVAQPESGLHAISNVTVHAASVIFLCPLIRDYAMAWGLRAVTRQAIETSIDQGSSPLIVTGGQAECLLSKVTDQELRIVTYHFGFLRLAMKHSRPAVPVLNFGEQNIFGNFNCPRLQLWFLRRIGFPFPMMPMGFLNLPIPRKTNLRIVIGAPVYPDEGFTDPDNNFHVQLFATKYFNSIRVLFYKHRDRCGFPEMSLYYHHDKRHPLAAELQIVDKETILPMPSAPKVGAVKKKGERSLPPPKRTSSPRAATSSKAAPQPPTSAKGPSKSTPLRPAALDRQKSSPLVAPAASPTSKPSPKKGSRQNAVISTDSTTGSPNVGSSRTRNSATKD